ncbi:MAG: hypothetical protein ACKOHK_15095, partial [Planctomycetia bacterium]
CVEPLFAGDDVAVDPVQDLVQDPIQMDESFAFAPADFDEVNVWPVDAWPANLWPVDYEPADGGFTGDDSGWWQESSLGGCLMISSMCDWQSTGLSVQAWPADSPVADTFLAVDGGNALTLVGQPDWLDTCGWTVTYLYEGRPVEVAWSDSAIMDPAVSGSELVTIPFEASAPVPDEPVGVEIAVSAPASTMAADTARLYAAFAAGIGQAGTDGQAAVPIGSRRGPRR